MDLQSVCQMRFSKFEVADREGFEPSVTLRLRVLSRDVVSANSPTGPAID